MKNYFQKILSLFARHNYSEQTNQMFYRWLVDNEYEKEKDEALQELYLEARKKGPTSAVLIGALGIARIPYEVWVKWFAKILLLFVVLGFLLLIPTVVMQLPGF